MTWAILLSTVFYVFVRRMHSVWGLAPLQNPVLPAGLLVYALCHWIPFCGVGLARSVKHSVLVRHPVPTQQDTAASVQQTSTNIVVMFRVSSVHWTPPGTPMQLSIFTAHSVG